jgi:tRNA nucleotidyltransferase (CCA-adding enzyme)
MRPRIPNEILELVEAIKTAGGKAYLVGGGVIDQLMDKTVKDWDIEVFNLSYDNLLDITMQTTAKADLIGQKFGIIKTFSGNYDIELSIPRKDNKTGPKHKDFDVTLIPNMTVEEAAKRRDFTINAIYYDFETGEYIDPVNGITHLRSGLLHPVDRDTFKEDPLRAFRALQILARKCKIFSIELAIAISELVEGCNHLTGDAILGEMNKLLMMSKKPSIGLELLAFELTSDITVEYFDNLSEFNSALIYFFPELQALIGCKQREKYHPEGDVWTHTLMVIDQAARYRDELPEEWRLPFMWGMLLHDVGKPIATRMNEEKGHLTSIDHDKLGEPIARKFMERLTNNKDLIDKVCSIVKVHMRPRLLLKATPKRAAWRRLQNICPLNILAYVSMCDNDGRGDPLERCGKEDESFIKTMEVHKILGSPTDKIKPVLMGRHLIQHGFKPGPKFGPILEKAYKYQLETGCENVQELIDYSIG